MSQNAPSAGASPAPEAVEKLLAQLVSACFVLTDRNGSVTRWSRPAEELFGWATTALVGRRLFETLAVPGALPPLGGVMEATARRRDGTEVSVEFTVVPVTMAQSLEFNGFLEELTIVAPRGDALTRLEQSHPAVVDGSGRPWRAGPSPAETRRGHDRGVPGARRRAAAIATASPRASHGSGRTHSVCGPRPPSARPLS